MRTKIIIFLTFTSLIGFWTESKAVDVSLGATVWYAKWDIGAGTGKQYDPAFVYGPVASIGFNKEWSLSSVLLYGEYEKNYDPGLGYSATSSISRMDSDTTLNYNINRYFKVFAGGKYFRMKITTDSNDPGLSNTEVIKGFGPALGMGFTIPVTDSLFFMGNLAGMKTWISGSNSSGYGYNTALMIAYYFDSISTSVNLGYRVQNLDVESSGKKFYGPTVSAVYTF